MGFMREHRANHKLEDDSYFPSTTYNVPEKGLEGEQPVGENPPASVWETPVSQSP
jgi:hypothetical protein